MIGKLTIPTRRLRFRVHLPRLRDIPASRQRSIPNRCGNTPQIRTRFPASPPHHSLLHSVPFLANTPSPPNSSQFIGQNPNPVPDYLCNHRNHLNDTLGPCMHCSSNLFLHYRGKANKLLSHRSWSERHELSSWLPYGMTLFSFCEM